MAKPAKSSFVCQNCGAVSPRWAGKCAACGEWNTHGRGGRRGAAAGLRPRRSGREGPRRSRSRRWPGAASEVAAHADRHRRARPRHRRRHRAGLGAADRRRARHRQVDAAAAAGRRLRASAGRRAVYFSGEEAAAQVRLRAERLGLSPSAGGARRRDQPRQHPGDAGRGPARRPGRHRLDPDAVGRRARRRARHGQPGARRHAVADPLRQGSGRAPCCSSATSPRTARSPARR